jgi:hypothetical protein
MRRNPRFRGFIVSIVLALCAGVAAAQVDVGQLGGQVKDETGAALPGATVTATSIERGFSRSTVTDTTGRFVFSQTAPGRYKVTVSLSGFATVTVTDNLVENQKKTEIAVTMKLSAQQAEVTVSGEVPIVDKTQGALESRQRAKEFEKMPVGRGFQNLFLNAPGVNLPPGANPNPNVHGALGGNNLWMYDGVDTTDPTTGTFGGNLNFEAIQEVVVQTSAVSAEYGRVTGGVINVITKSGTNTFAGSFKDVMTNDNWNVQNKTVNTNQTAACTPNCSTSLARVKFVHLNQSYAATLGGPLWPDHIWFFGGYEPSSITGARQTTPISGENYQQTTHSKFWDGKLTAQITPSVQFSARGSSSPTNGFVVNYAFFGSPGELVAYTGQDQTSKTYAGFLTGVFGSNLTGEAQYNWNGPSNTSSTHYIDVYPFAGAGAMHYSQANGFQYNGPTFNGYVNRPRQGMLGAMTYFAELGGNSHSFKAGVDYQHLSSASQFGFVNNQVFIDNSFDYVTRVFSPNTRRDYDVPVASISDGKIIAVYARDKFEMGKMLFMELGLRYEHQTSKDDINRTTVSAGTFSPRVSLSYDIFSTGKSLVVGTYGRFYQFVLQTFSDGFAQNAQQASYNNYNWNGTQYVFSSRVLGSGSSANPNSNIKPTFVDEGTLGFRQQIGNTVGVTLTGIYRHWGNLIDDIPILDSAGNQTTTYANYGGAVRKFWGAELVLDKRFSEHWNANASYAWGKTTTNTISNTASSLGDYPNSNCRTTVDLTIGTNGVIPCAIVNDGSNKTGLPNYNQTSAIKGGGAYVQSIGPVNVAVGLGGSMFTGVHYQKQRSMNVLIPGTTTNAGPTETYFYDARGTESTPTIYQIDGSLETTFTVFKTLELGVKGEVFNITDQQKQRAVDQTTWCDNAAASATSSCGLARTNFGKATARGSFQPPRTYRLTALLRF